jgi:excisionase family DNA binding protein
MNPRFYTITQVASMLGITVDQVTERIPLERIGNLYRIKEENLQTYLEENK